MVVTLLLLVVGATYAYFTMGGNSGTTTDVNVTTHILTFELGEGIEYSSRPRFICKWHGKCHRHYCC